MLILVAEDEPYSALSAVWELEQAGHEVLGPAASFEEAVRLAERQSPDLALIDIDLQHTGGGVALARRLQADEVPSLFVSAEQALARRHSDLALGCIGKPYNPADLPGSIEAVDALLHGRAPPSWVPRSLRLFRHASPE